MARRARRNHTTAFKAKAALAAIKGEKTMSALAPQFDVHANQNKQWREQLCFLYYCNASTTKSRERLIALRICSSAKKGFSRTGSL
jgi:hypothetical protein